MCPTRATRFGTFVRLSAPVLVLAAGLSQSPLDTVLTQRIPIPRFEFDPAWPKIPKGRILGNIEGLYVDSRDHVWVAHRPGTVPNLYWSMLQRSECCVPLPPVSEFDQVGNFVQGFGPISSRQPKMAGVTATDDMPKTFDWPAAEHGMFVDDKDGVWLAGSGANDGQVLKFTRAGKLLLQIGKPGQSTGNSDTRNMFKPTRVWVAPKTNEAFVADGYVNRRIVVYDADTGAFKRMWGAYGAIPTDPTPEDRPKFLFNDTEPGHRPRDDKGEGRGPDYFNIAHSVAVSRDELVYVADRLNNRVQIFTTTGQYLRELFIQRKSLGYGTAMDIAFSPDAHQTYLYVADATNGAVRIFHRQSLTLLGSFGELGHQGGQLDQTHNIAVDSRGNLYTGDVTGAKIQRWLYKGTS
jgi:hypothetical protein